MPAKGGIAVTFEAMPQLTMLRRGLIPCASEDHAQAMADPNSARHKPTKVGTAVTLDPETVAFFAVVVAFVLFPALAVVVITAAVQVYVHIPHLPAPAVAFSVQDIVEIAE